MDSDRSVPGTVHLVDLEGVLNAMHASGSHTDIVLVPSPSTDPDDPLNWSVRRKLLSTACVCVYVAPRCVQVPWPSIDGLDQLHTVDRHYLRGNLLCPRAHSKRHGSNSG